MAKIVRTDELLKYYNQEKLPTIWCPGCGLGTVTRALVTAIHELGIDREKTIFVSGIGCSGRMTGYLDFSSVHVTHGRALSFATGIKLANPELNVIVIMGDGDASAIGGNHLIHAARRNIGVTALVCNNSIYGMTGGQYSPTTPTGDTTTTSLYGNIEPGFDLCKLAEAAGASFVGRGTAFHTPALTQVIKEAITHDGFSFVEAITQCPTYYGRKNNQKTPFAMLERQKKGTISAKLAEATELEEIAGRMITGVLHQVARTEYTTAYAEIVKRAQAAAVDEAAVEPHDPPDSVPASSDIVHDGGEAEDLPTRRSDRTGLSSASGEVTGGGA